MRSSESQISDLTQIQAQSVTKGRSKAPEAYLNKPDLVRVPERPKTPSISVYFDGEDQSNPDTTNKEERREEEAKG
ncbi:hypothetical protein Bca4012_100501 [Brassica carinata]|uniref:Uncharacterized protein n=2 Tax=Brassica TaxID=3705 RepID=A0A3P6FWZ6_BRAOL|nr:unnamed protein product [Brassica napus]CDY26246.1 BnaA06g11710D [Brassica napus]VDD62913.1 unnamed protein product [Brassica oleracea]